MSSYNSRVSAFPGGPPFFQDTSISQFNTPENAALIQSAWAASIDPLLQSTRESLDNTYLESKMTLRNQRQNQQKPLERYLGQADNRVFFNHEQTHNFSQGFLPNLNRQSAPIQSVPHSSRPRMISPCPSQEPTSTISSSASPGPDPEWPSDSQYSQPKDEFYLPPAAATSFIGHSFDGHNFDWSGNGLTQLPSYPRNTCVNMTQIQGMPDLQPEEVTYEGNDEGYVALEMKTEYAVDMKSEYAVEMKQEHYHSNNTYNYHEIDEGIGASIKDEASPQASGSTQTHHSDIDAEGEEEEDDEDIDIDMDEEPIPIDDPISDTEYTPKRSSSRRRIRRSSNPKPIKNSRISKSSKTSRNGSRLTCKQCPTLPVPFHSLPELQNHINTTHQLRPYTCVFHFAGCPSTFTSKNEWKRHVSSQHLNLTAWVCELGACHKSTRRSEFNRKDLFTQHLRRMHTPNSVKRNGKRNGEWEDRVRALQNECLVVKREAPAQLGCPVGGCGMWFEGRGAWDDRMEHVGKHLEKGAAEGFGGGGGLVGVGGSVDQGDDQCLVSWALTEGIIEEKPGCGREQFRLCVGEKEKEKEKEKRVEVRSTSEEGDVDVDVDADADADAEGEDDV